MATSPGRPKLQVANHVLVSRTEANQSIPDTSEVGTQSITFRGHLMVIGADSRADCKGKRTRRTYWRLRTGVCCETAIYRITSRVLR
jgi:hypothetical protein